MRTESSGEIRAHVERARRVRQERFAGSKIYANAQMGTRLIRKYCLLNAACEQLLENAITRMGLSARAHDRILKVSRTIADLDGVLEIEPKHVAEAIQYRSLD